MIFQHEIIRGSDENLEDPAEGAWDFDRRDLIHIHICVYIYTHLHNMQVIHIDINVIYIYIYIHVMVCGMCIKIIHFDIELQVSMV